MIIAVDTNSILPGQVGGIESYTLGLIEVLKRPQSPASTLVLLTRPENHALFRRFADARTQVLQIDRPQHNGQPVTNWAELQRADPDAARRALAQFQQNKIALLHRLKVDVVHFPGNTINPLELDLPVVLNLHDLQHRHFPQYFTADEIANREKWWVASAMRADALLAASDYVKNDLHTELGVDPTRVFVTPDTLQAEFLKTPSAESLPTLRRQSGLPRTFFLYPAAVWPHKNHQRLIRAFAAANLHRTQLLLTGGGQADSTLSQFIESLGLEGKVRLLGRVETADLIGLYHLATAMIFPSEHESWSIPVMEAMACGCPVACSNVTSLPQEVGNAGLLFDPQDVGAITAAILRLASDPLLRAELSLRGKARVAEFTPQHCLETLSAAYDRAIANHRRRKAA